MSTLKVNSIKNTSTNDGGIAIDNSGHVQIDGQQFPTAGPLSNRNLIINGAMQVSQRATSVTSVTASNYITVDRYKFVINSLGTWTVTQESDGPDGFSKSFKALCTTADASPASSDYLYIMQRIEAQNLQGLAYGTSSAKALTLSFYVKSNKTGNASVNVRQQDNSNKIYAAQYSISSANTWERKTISVPADTAGVINNDNGGGLQVEWWLNSGSDYTTGSHGGWKTSDATSRNASNLGVGGAVDDYFQITGVQLEVGSVATPFEHRSYADELARCQRYLQKLKVPIGSVTGRMSTGGTQGYFVNLPTPVTIRALPSSDGGDFILRAEGGSSTLATISMSAVNSFAENHVCLKCTTGGTTGYRSVINSDAIELDAEL
jgi:hypothetical protein